MIDIVELKKKLKTKFAGFDGNGNYMLAYNFEQVELFTSIINELERYQQLEKDVQRYFELEERYYPFKENDECYEGFTFAPECIELYNLKQKLQQVGE